MIRRLYVHNFRCLENFELPLAKMSTALLIGKNGAGKTTIGMALRILQKIARGENRVSSLLRPDDFTRGQSDLPMRFEIEVSLEERIYIYSLAFDLPKDFKELRVSEEKFSVDGKSVFDREIAQVRLERASRGGEAAFRIDWHLVALPIIQEGSPSDPIFVFKNWLASMIFLKPIPSMMRGDSDAETTQPEPSLNNFGSWFSGLIASSPSSYVQMDQYLKSLMPDLHDIKNPLIARESRNLIISFKLDQSIISIPFDGLSDGEKCFMICAVAIASNIAYGPVLCFWDEPDNYLGPSEVGSTIIALRRAFQDHGQLLITSHNPEAIRRFSDENTFVVFRKSHFEPTMLRTVGDLRANGEFDGSLVDALLRGDIA